MVSDWVSEEMDTVDIGDKRLNDGLIELLSMMAASPSKSIPAAVNGGHNETTAAYRLFDNERVSFENVLEPHIDATYARLSQEKVVIVAQDTTEIDLTRPKVQVEGAGPLDGGSRFGEFLHPLIAFTPNGTPLGILSAELWTRDHGPSKADDRKKKPIEEKESVRWLDTHRHAQEIALQHPETEIVCVADSEADIFEVIELDRESPDNFQWIIRSCYDRSVITEDSDEATYLYTQLAACEPIYSKRISVRGREPKLACDKRARNQPRISRQCEMEVRATTVILRGSSRPDRKLNNTTVNAVLAEEVGAPEGETPVRWLLLTNMPISTKKEIELVIAYYCIRWLIEIFFRTLKSGCRIEGRRFEKIERFERCLAVTMIVAWRTLYTTRIGREYPDASCECVFAKDEWQPVYQIVMQEPPPKKPPTLQTMIRLIARLGGYIERARNDEPGPDTTMRGMERLYDISVCWRIFGPNTTQTRRKICV